MVKIDQKLLDQLAELEVKAILEALEDPDQCSPAWAARARAFLKDNRLETTPQTARAEEIERRLREAQRPSLPIPTFEYPASEH